MTETNKMLEECANYLLNHCFVLGGVEDQRAKYLYVQDHLNEVRAVFAPLGYSVVLYPAPLQAAALVNEHEGSQARLRKSCCAPCAGTIWPGRWDGFPGWTAASKYSPLYCLLCRIPTLRTLPPR